MSRKGKRRPEGFDQHKLSSIKSKNKQIPRKEERLYTFFAYLTFSKTVCTIRNIQKSILIRDFKEHLVLTCGVPLSIQRLHYLDSCELDDEDDLCSLDIVDNASFRLSVWNNFEKLMRCIHENDFETLLTCSIQVPKDKVDNNNNDNNNTSDAVDHEEDAGECGTVVALEKHETINDNTKRAETALFVASQVGQLNIIKNLLEMGVDVNCMTELGYTPLHAAVAGGRYDCIDYLLEKGAQCDTKSNQAKKAMSIAKMNGFQESERHLHSFEWQTRAKKVQPSPNTPLLMHQQFDSQYPTWINGQCSTKYICSTLPRSEFSGTRIDAPISNPPKTPDTRKRYNVIPDIYVPKDDGDNDGDTKRVSFKEGLPFETWLRNKKEQKLISIQQSIEDEKRRQREKQEKERYRRSRKMSFYEEQKKRKSRIHDDFSDRNKISMYEDHKYLPNYQSSIIHHYMNELMLEHE